MAGAIITRVNADVEASVDRLAGLRRIGIDEISYKRGHRYLIVVVDHDTGHLVWAGPGRTDAALEVFFDELGDERAAELTHVSADTAGWIARAVAKRAPNAQRCADPFHVVAWVIEALDVERRRAWNQASGRNKETNPPLSEDAPEAPCPASHAPATRSGSTPKISPRTNAPSSTGSPRPTPEGRLSDEKA